MRSAVDREGSLLRVVGEGDARTVAKVTSIVESIGYIAQPVEDAAHVTRWFGADDVEQLSQEEASILAERWAAELVLEGIICETAGLTDVLASGLLAAFRDAARTGEIGTVQVDLGRLRKILSEQDAGAVRAWIRTRLGHPAG